MRYKVWNPDGAPNEILATQDYVEQVFPGKWELMEQPPEAVPSLPRHITVGAFLARFEDRMLEILMSTIPEVQALIVYARSQTYINLDDPRLAKHLPMLVAFDLLTNDELEQILTAEPQPEERP